MKTVFRSVLLLGALFVGGIAFGQTAEKKAVSRTTKPVMRVVGPKNKTKPAEKPAVKNTEKKTMDRRDKPAPTLENK